MTTALTRAVARLLLAPTFVVAGAFLVKGYADVGDGFTAGVVAALGVLAQFLAFGEEEAGRLRVVRYALPAAFAGLLLALVVAFQPVLRGEPILTHSPAAGADVVRVGTLELTTAVLFDVGVFLLVYGASVGIIRAVARAGRGPE